MIAKNYLAENELELPERIVNGYLDFAEEYVKRHVPLTRGLGKTFGFDFASKRKGFVTKCRQNNGCTCQTTRRNRT